MDVARLLVVASLCLAAAAFVPSASADPVCVFNDDPQQNPPWGDSGGCVFLNEGQSSWNCVDACVYVFTGPADVCLRAEYHSPYVCLSYIIST